MNGYPYPVLTEVDSAYRPNIHFSIEFTKYSCNEDKVLLSISLDFNSETLKKHIREDDAELVVKAVTGIRSLVFRFNEVYDNLNLEVCGEDIKSNDNIILTAFVVTKRAFNLCVTEEMEEYFGTDFSISLNKGDILAVSNNEKLNYNTTNNDFIRIRGSEECSGKGISIRLSEENHIVVLVGSEFRHAYATISDPRIKPILSSHIVFEAFVYTLVEIVQANEDYSGKEWYRLFSQAFAATGDDLEVFRQKAIDDGKIVMSEIFDVAQRMISNSLETTTIKASRMEG